MTKEQYNNRIAFLFGAGVSIPAGLPDTQSITSQRISGDNIMHDSDGNYYFGEPEYAHTGNLQCVPRIPHVIY